MCYILYLQKAAYGPRSFENRSFQVTCINPLITSISWYWSPHVEFCPIWPVDSLQHVFGEPTILMENKVISASSSDSPIVDSLYIWCDKCLEADTMCSMFPRKELIYYLIINGLGWGNHSCIKILHCSGIIVKPPCWCITAGPLEKWSFPISTFIIESYM